MHTKTLLPIDARLPLVPHQVTLYRLPLCRSKLLCLCSVHCSLLLLMTIVIHRLTKMLLYQCSLHHKQLLLITIVLRLLINNPSRSITSHLLLFVQLHLPCAYLLKPLKVFREIVVLVLIHMKPYNRMNLLLVYNNRLLILNLHPSVVFLVSTLIEYLRPSPRIPNSCSSLFQRWRQLPIRHRATIMFLQHP